MAGLRADPQALRRWRPAQRGALCARLASTSAPSRPRQAAAPAAPPPPPPPRAVDRSSPQYKREAQRWTGLMVGLPVLLVSSYFLFERLVLKTEPRRQFNSAAPTVDGRGGEAVGGLVGEGR